MNSFSQTLLFSSNPLCFRNILHLSIQSNMNTNAQHVIVNLLIEQTTYDIWKVFTKKVIMFKLNLILKKKKNMIKMKPYEMIFYASSRAYYCNDLPWTPFVYIWRKIGGLWESIANLKMLPCSLICKLHMVLERDFQPRY